MKKIPIQYLRAGLSEVTLCNPEVNANEKPIEIGQIDGVWVVTKAQPNVKTWVNKQIAESKESTAKGVPFVLVAGRLSAKVDGGVKRDAEEINKGMNLVCVPCVLDAQGKLYPAEDMAPWIPRDYLEPSLMSATVGELDDYDEFMGELPGKVEDIKGLLQLAANMFQKVTGTQLPLLREYEGKSKGDEAPAFQMAGYTLVSEWYGVAYKPPIIARHLIKLYDQTAEGIKNGTKLPLLDSMLDTEDRPSRPPVAVTDAASVYAGIVGHIDHEFQLSESQREAMTELVNLGHGEVLAVNGPPGTGKTTLLQSVVSQLWVDAALKKGACPLILVTSTNVKAVENVLDSFQKIGGRLKHPRWTDYKGGFGVFLLSGSRETTFPFCTSDSNSFKDIETPDGVDNSRKVYLQHASKYFRAEQTSVDAVVDKVHEELVEHQSILKEIIRVFYGIYRLTGDDGIGVTEASHKLRAKLRADAQTASGEIATAEAEMEKQTALIGKVSDVCARAVGVIDGIEQQWLAHVGGTSIWLDLFSPVFPFVNARRNNKDRAFLIQHVFTKDLYSRKDDVTGRFTGLCTKAEAVKKADTAPLAIARVNAERLKTQAITKRNNAIKDIGRIDTLLGELSSVLAKDKTLDGLKDASLVKLNDHLDLLIRAEMFCIADRYWTGKWLLEMKDRLAKNANDNKAPAKLESKYRRFAKLSPCLVSNLHIAPSFFTGWITKEVSIPLFETIDLLVMDESGQVSPDVGLGVFALAKRAVVVGDTFQIEPVWNAGESADRANAAKFGMTMSKYAPLYDELVEKGYTAAKGNMMKVARRGCAVQKYDDMRGLMLTEHRRCVPDIVAYCNDLVYGGRLQPLRPANPNSFLPPFSYVHVEGVDEAVSKSRKNAIEADVIVKWIGRNRDAIQNHYRDQKTGLPGELWKILAVVTPFKTQAALIESKLQKEIPDLAYKNTKLTVGTVHALQGAEREMVIFSATYGKGYSGGMFFDKSPNMLNVAVSRAKDSFIVVGYMPIFDPSKTSKPSGLLARHLNVGAKS